MDPANHPQLQPYHGSILALAKLLILDRRWSVAVYFTPSTPTQTVGKSNIPKNMITENVREIIKKKSYADVARDTNACALTTNKQVRFVNQ